MKAHHKDKAKRNPAKVRLTLEVSEAVQEKLQQLRLQTDSPSAVEVIRRAIEVYGKIVEYTSAGGKIVVHHPDGSTKELILL